MFEIDFFGISFYFVFGAFLGSFANVVIYRLQKEESVVAPRSYCPACKNTIPIYLNIPVLSWFFLKGKCFSCKSKISFRYPLVEILVGVLYSCSYLKLAGTWYFYEVLVLIWGLVVISFIDYDSYIIPDKISLPGMAVGLLGAILNPEREWLNSFLGIVMGGGFLWAIAVIYFKIKKEEGMGGGDIKLLAWIGAVTGWKSIAFIILISSLIGSILGIGLILKERESVKKVIPFGPFLALASILYILFGEDITNWYLNLFFPWS